MKENKIHVGFGFHVNCYHSYRGDTNDNLGFGSDIRIIRQIIEVLDKCNADGIPVKGTWDCENFFSLEQILPKYAPDIIENMQRRVKENGDEQIIMGYSNGALAPMNEDEFQASMNLAISNEKGSGLKDLFGEFEKIVRPQEVMFTPSQVSVYNKCGIRALCLYYSCVPFDAFRTIVPKMADEIAFNPLTYTYKGESMTILPTYNNSDICDAGCMRSWVKDLRKKQESGEINNDLFVFVNMDADAIFWESMNLPIKLANTDGINGLVREIADLDYVVFNTPGKYLDTHENIGEIDFTQDTADGNFTGFASWSEKPYNRKIWTKIDRSRALSKASGKKDSESASFFDRVCLLSTTHFGLATPVLNIQREKVADELSQKIIDEELSIIDLKEEIVVKNISDSNVIGAQFSVSEHITDVSSIVIKSTGLEDYVVIPMDDELNSVYILMKFKSVKKQYKLKMEIVKNTEENPFTLELSGSGLWMKFSVSGNIYEVNYNGRELSTEGFLKSFITYDGEEFEFKRAKAQNIKVGGTGECVRVSGEIHLPKEIEGGSFIYDFIKVPFSEAIFVKTNIKYPYTPETTSISTENSSLGRYSDMKWTEAVPFQITLNLNKDAKVIKRNYMDDISTFRTQSFVECDEKNKSLNSFNHQISAGLVGVGDDEGGLLIANAKQVLGSMAHCPMRLDEDGTVHMNPFGTYYGNQRHHWSRSKEQILATYVLVTPQGKSIAPAYNGNSETAMLALYGYDADNFEDVCKEACAFADGGVVAGENEHLSYFYGDNVSFKEAKADGIKEEKLMNPIMSGIAGNINNYITKGARAIGHIVREQIKSRK